MARKYLFPFNRLQNLLIPHTPIHNSWSPLQEVLVCASILRCLIYAFPGRFRSYIKVHFELIFLWSEIHGPTSLL